MIVVIFLFFFFFSSRRRHTICALVTGVQTCALPILRTIPVGPVPDHQRRMFDACAEALEACKAALRPGRPIGEVFDAHARVMDARGFADARLNACGYSLGAMFSPIWMDYPMFYRGNPEPAEPGMVFFLHMIMMDSADRKRVV